MDNYIIRHVDGGYLYRAKNDKWERTSALNKATRLTYEKAFNVLNNCIGPNLRNCWEIVEDETLIFVSENNDEKNDLDGFNWEEISLAQYTLYNELTQYSEQLRCRLSEVDLEICDIQHYIEFFALDAAKGYKAYRMLKERLERRRHIKDEMAKANWFLTGTSADFSSGKVDRQIKGIENCKYTPRILNELFGLESTGSKLQHVS